MKMIKRKIKNYIRDFIRVLLTREQYIRYRFYFTHKYRLNLKKPKTWNEKIQYRKLFGDHKLYAEYIDKYSVRKKIKEILGEKYLIPLIAKYDKITVEDIENLPSSFVIKTSNGGGGENVRIIREKEKINKEKLCKEFNRYLKIKIGEKIDEPYYDFNKASIIVENLILDSENQIPNDYKFHCFRDEERMKIIIQVDAGRFKKHRRNFYDEEWKILGLKIAKKGIDYEVKKPQNLEEMLICVDKISKIFDYSRIDMYNVDGKIYFGEITFAHGSGYEKLPYDWDLKMGELWNLKYNPS